jgi:diacylglycerol kinase (ATP)
LLRRNRDTPSISTVVEIESAASPRAPDKWLAVLNPSAGSPKGNGWLRNLRERLEVDLGAEVVITRDLAHVAQVLDAANAATALAVCGGDGSIAEVVNRMNLDHQRLLVLPAGSGNGLARDLGITSMERAFGAVRANACWAIDVLRVTFSVRDKETCRLAISTCALGYVAEVVVLTQRWSRRLGSWRYVFASLLQAKRMPAYPFTIQVDNESPTERQLTNLMINNTKYAGNFRVFQSASLFDSRMDALLANNPFWPQILHNVAVLTRTYIYSRGEQFTAKSLHLTSATPFRLMLDGEIWDSVNDASFAVLPKQLLCYFYRPTPSL